MNLTRWWWYMPLIPEFGRQRQVDLHEFAMMVVCQRATWGNLNKPSVAKGGTRGPVRQPSSGLDPRIDQP